MYTHRQYKRSVRDGAPHYGTPFPSEEFPGAGALQDLASAPESEIPLVLARYAALRAWGLAREGEPDEVLSHAVSAALAHLEALADRWTEKVLLRDALLNDALLNNVLLEDALLTDALPKEALLRGALPAAPDAGPPVATSLRLLREAAASADSLGHVHGARALRESVYRAGWWLKVYTPPSLS